MKSKKFVLAGLALLAAITMVLLPLAGCKNDTVPEPTRYTVKFETDHGTDPDNITVVSGTKLTDKDLAIEPEAGDNIFEYWYDKDDDAQKPVEEGYTVTKDVTLVAKWRDRGIVASVIFSPADVATLYYGDTVTLSTTEEATIHYTMNGEEKTGASPVTVNVTGNTTITARATKDGLKPSAETTATYTVRKLEGISVTPSTRTVYSVGEKVAGEIEVTATYDDGEERPVTGTITTDTSTLTQSAGVKTVTVSYSEGGSSVTKDFPVDVVNVGVPTKLTTYTSPNNTDNSWTYMAFGEWPQTEAVDFKPTTAPQSHGIFVDNYYVEGNDKYVKEGDKYYKVEPIVWRVLNKDYASTGKALLLAESILTGGIPYYVDTSSRRITEKEGFVTVYPNNWQYSTIRAWLNGRYEEKDSQLNTYTDKGFLQTAFTESARKLIADTSVDNSAASTIPSGIRITDKDYELFWNSGENPYASDTPTKDKIFLLSEQEATNSDYGFDEYDRWVGDDYGTTTSTRIRDTTDYAEATGAYPGDSSAGYGGWWWLRSPLCLNEYYARDIDFDGYANGRNDRDFVGYAYVGVVPALSISLQ